MATILYHKLRGGFFRKRGDGRVEKELRTIITVDLASLDTNVSEMLKAYEVFKEKANKLAPGFADGNISICIKNSPQ